MSKVLGIIAEYNPFHNGHLYHLENSKKLTDCDYTIAIISGNFTQRGSTSLIDKWEKTKAVLLNDVDLVIELPVLYSISSAENFADGAVKILNSLGIVDYLSFGAEHSNISDLNKIADILCNEPEEYKRLLLNELKTGISFPKARENALIKYLDNDSYLNILSSPNNILGIEYLKALRRYNSNIKPISISRTQVGYNSNQISNNIASATAIRNLVKNEDFDIIKSSVPESTYSVLMYNVKSGRFVTDFNTFGKEILYILRRMSIEEIANLPDISEGLEFAIKNAVNSCNSLSELLDSVKSKRYTATRIQRIFLYALLGISKFDMEISRNTLPYIRILGFNDNGKKLVSEISKMNPNISIITSVKKFVDCNIDDNLKLMLSKDVFATNVYCSGFNTSYIGNLDYKNKIVKI